MAGRRPVVKIISESLSERDEKHVLATSKRPVVKLIAESLSHDKKHVVPTPLSGIQVGKRKGTYLWK
jgi:hypothetical protein